MALTYPQFVDAYCNNYFWDNSKKAVEKINN
jgi:hypothetical protein